MNTKLNLGRVILLLKRYFLENTQRELSFWGIVILVFTIMHQSGSVEVFLYISGLIFAAQQFKIFAYTPSGMHYLLIPATHTEKLTTSILLTIPYYFLMVVLTYIIGTTIGIAVQNLVFGLDMPMNYEFLNSINQFNGTPDELKVFTGSSIINTFGVFAFLQSLFLLGSLYFKRNSAVKTLLSIAFIVLISSLVQGMMFKLLFGSYSFNSMNFLNLNYDFSNSLTLNATELLYKVGFWLAIPFFWIVSYFRLTEKQV